MTEPMVIAGVIKWCWSRLQNGVVGWDAYELFKVGEQGMRKDRISICDRQKVDKQYHRFQHGSRFFQDVYSA